MRGVVNRANAQHSTGPRTPEGKDRSRRNALSHGLYARTLAAAGEALGEDREAFEALHRTLIADYDPQGVVEKRLVERLAFLCSRLERLSVHARRKLARALAAGEDSVAALLRLEQIAPAEARLQRAIVRLHKDLLFLGRYRQRTRQQDADREARQRARNSRADAGAILARIAELESEFPFEADPPRESKTVGALGDEPEAAPHPSGVAAGVEVEPENARRTAA